MAIDRPDRNGPITFFCDAGGCSENIETDEVDFTLAHIIMKENGWRTVLVGKSSTGKKLFDDLCPDCQ